MDAIRAPRSISRARSWDAGATVATPPLLEETRDIVGTAALAAMRPDVVIIDVGRGPVIDEQALYDSLATRRIGGAIIDTWYAYLSAEMPTSPPSRQPFETLDNVVMTPPMSGWSDGTVRRLQNVIADNINRLQRGAPLINKLRSRGILDLSSCRIWCQIHARCRARPAQFKMCRVRK